MSSSVKRILFVENGIGYGGAVVCMLHLVRALDRSRFEPTIVTGRTDKIYAALASDARWIGIEDRVFEPQALRHKLGTFSWTTRFTTLNTVLLQCIARLDDVVNFLPFFLRLCWTVLRIRPHIIHANNEPVCNRAALLAARLLRIPAVCHVRGDQSGSRSMRWLFRLPDHLIPVSKWVATSISALGVPPQKQTMIYDGIDFNSLDLAADGRVFRNMYGIPYDAFAIGLPGILIEWKGQLLFLKAARLLVDEFPDMHFVIVGGTPQECRPFEMALRTFIDDNHLGGRVSFTGHLSEMSAAYRALDVVVSASIAPEPLGVVIVEAMAMSRPVVAPAHGGALEVVEDMHTGLLFTPNSAVALAEALRRLRSDASLRASLSGAGRQHIIDMFSAERNAREVESVYQQVLIARQA